MMWNHFFVQSKSDRCFHYGLKSEHLFVISKFDMKNEYNVFGQFF